MCTSPIHRLANQFWRISANLARKLRILLGLADPAKNRVALGLSIFLLCFFAHITPNAHAQNTPVPNAQSTQAPPQNQALLPSDLPELPQQPSSRIVRVELHQTPEETQVHFVLSAKTRFSLFSNSTKKVAGIRFFHSSAALERGLRTLYFNTPYVNAVVFERSQKRSEEWAKVLLRNTNIAVRAFATTHNEEPRIVLALQVSSKSKAAQLTSVRVKQQGSKSILQLHVTATPQYEQTRRGLEHIIRLKQVQLTQGIKLRGADKRIAIKRVYQQGQDVLVRVQLKRTDLKVNAFFTAAPLKLSLHFSPPKSRKVVKKRKTLRPRAHDKLLSTSVISALKQSNNSALTALYSVAENRYAQGNVALAMKQFQKIARAAAGQPLGVEATFRLADLHFEISQKNAEKNLHPVIALYQGAIREAEALRHESNAIPRALFNIAQAYRQMKFHHEATVHFHILQDRFPKNTPYTADSFYSQGRSYLVRGELSKALKAFRTFLTKAFDPDLEGRNHLLIGETLHKLGQHVQARAAFNRGRAIDPNYAQTNPALLFYMAETFYETNDLDATEQIAQSLSQNHPNSLFAKLVGLRLGDLLRNKRREREALAQYAKSAQNAPALIMQRAWIRMADIFSREPEPENLKQALALYDRALDDKGIETSLRQEVALRKALALLLHGNNLASLKILDTLAKDKQAFERWPGLIETSMKENLKLLVERWYLEEKYWDIARLRHSRKNTAAKDFVFDQTLYQMGYAVEVLGLYGVALALYDKVQSQLLSPWAPLALYQLLKVHLEQDNLEEAAQALQTLARRYPDHPSLVDGQLLLARGYLGSGNHLSGLQILERLTKQALLYTNPAGSNVQKNVPNPSLQQPLQQALPQALPEAYHFIGETYKTLGRFARAEQAYQAAILHYHYPVYGDNVPDFIPLSRFNIGDMLFKLREDRRAIEAYAMAITRYPNHPRTPWAHYQTGLALRRLGEDTRALEVFTALVEQSKSRPEQLWAPMAQQNKRDLESQLRYRDYIQQ